MRAGRVALAMALAAAGPAAAADLLVDLSQSEVEITTAFAGSNLLLFGATEADGHVVVVVRGAPGLESVRRKERFAGIWINREEVVFANTPAFYWVAASGPIESVLSEDQRARFQIGLNDLVLVPRDQREFDPKVRTFREALVRNKQDQGLYQTQPAWVDFVGGQVFKGGRLFRTNIRFPANVPLGVYVIDAYLARGGVVTAERPRFIQVRKSGIEAAVFDFAHRNSFAYGLLAVVIAAYAGWLASLPFRRS